jgi:hypothetical protein
VVVYFKSWHRFIRGDLDFEHLHEAAGKDANLQPGTVAVPPGKRKRKGTFEDGFSDIEIDDFELDEDDLKELQRIESPEKLPNGNYRCNHLCKDRMKYESRCKHLF